MLRIGNTIFSFDILEKKFICNLGKCHGDCCRYGDSGAPLTKEEVRILKEIWPKVKPYVSSKGIETILKTGTSITDFENESVTPLVNNEECAYSIIEDNIYKCGIEKAWFDGKVNFRKPLSCHLFPIRVKQFSTVKAVNYQELPICSSALEKGCGDGVYVYEFLKEPMIRAFGEDVYAELCLAASELREKNFI